MTAVELFAGISGFGLGFQRAGIEAVCQVEIDDNCRKLLTDKFPETVKLSDVRGLAAAYRRLQHEAKWKIIFSLLRAADVWCGGFPCQDLSVAGARAGLAGERSGLWFSFRRLVALFRPAWVVIENVPGLLSSSKGTDLTIVISGLEKLGYGVAWASLDSQYFGLAQRRERVFVVASLGTMRCAEVLFERESVCWDSAPSRETGQRVTPPIAGCSNGGGANGAGRTADDAEALIPMTAKPLGGHHHRTDLDNETYVPDCARSLRAQAQCSHRADAETFVMAHGQANSEVVSDGSPSLTCNHEAPILANIPVGFDAWQGGDTQHGTSKEHTPPLRCGARNAIAFTERTRKDGRNFEAQEECSYALTNPGSGGRTDSRQIAVNSTVRRLTPLECERLQGFPDGWTLGFSDSVRYRMLGNAVSVPVAEWIGRRLVKA